MSDGKSILIDVSRCTGCRGCQVACKQWNELPASKTKQSGTYQNPPDLDGDTYKVVRFKDGRGEDGKPYWNFFTDMCRHCVNPPCMSGAVGDELVHDEETGAIVYGPGSEKSDFETARDVCPYDIPRKNEKTGRMVKCTMCNDRIKEGMMPACVQSCPTGAMIFGERSDILAEVESRLATLQKTWPNAQAVDVDETRVIFLITDVPENYHSHVMA